MNNNNTMKSFNFLSFNLNKNLTKQPTLVSFKKKKKKKNPEIIDV